MVMINPKPEQTEDQPMIVVRFTAPGSAIFEAKFSPGITPTMLLALAGYLEINGKADLMEMREAAKVQMARLNPSMENLLK